MTSTAAKAYMKEKENKQRKSFGARSWSSLQQQFCYVTSKHIFISTASTQALPQHWGFPTAGFATSWYLLGDKTAVTCCCAQQRNAILKILGWGKLPGCPPGCGSTSAAINALWGDKRGDLTLLLTTKDHFLKSGEPWQVSLGQSRQRPWGPMAGPRCRVRPAWNLRMV